MGGSAHSAPSSRPIKPCWHGGRCRSGLAPPAAKPLYVHIHVNVFIVVCSKSWLRKNLAGGLQMCPLGSCMGRGSFRSKLCLMVDHEQADSSASVWFQQQLVYMPMVLSPTFSTASR